MFQNFNFRRMRVSEAFSIVHGFFSSLELRDVDYLGHQNIMLCISVRRKINFMC